MTDLELEYQSIQVNNDDYFARLNATVDDITNNLDDAITNSVHED